MDVSGTIQFIATLAEVIVAVIAFLIAVERRKTYGYFMGITFVLLVLFNLARIFALEVSSEGYALIFLMACISMLAAIWMLWKEQ
ncbi:hypothetical protein [Methanoregula sp.]|uniref:hypothetical protein n=1 Tax=Methanoregula sp. TaxID=2052170 RepID=UPI00236FECFB|nr:hypothetical protein [Methanoregula sp.]MDD1687508.1 hypothetical protein [Methanoregula sp.]